MTSHDPNLAARRAVEALRNGVPNREAVRTLGCNQPKAEARFVDMLDKASAPPGAAAGSQGMLVSAGFGAGKSHLLTHLEHLALSRNFVCSRVAISKETPLYDLGKVFVSAIENGRIRGRSGRLVEELASAVNPVSSDRYANFFRWSDRFASDGSLHPIFPASLCVYEKAESLDLNNDIEAFWAGERIQVSKIRSGLRKTNEAKRYRFKAPKLSDLPPQRLRFVIELMKAAGYRGWVVLLDEIELIGSYSILQRGRSYAEVARWMGYVQGEVYPGLMVVGAVTDDFASAIISPDGQKKDRDYIRPKLEGSARYGALASRAETGMRLLERDCIALEPPGEDDVRATMKTLRDLYGRAYGWQPPPPPEHAVTTGGAGFQRRMRYKVRAAINEWDLLRLRPGERPDTEFETFTQTYEENVDLERAVSDDPEPETTAGPR